MKDEDMQLINSIERSGLTQLNYLNLSGNKRWLDDTEAAAHLCAFI